MYAAEIDLSLRAPYFNSMNAIECDTISCNDNVVYQEINNRFLYNDYLHEMLIDTDKLNDEGVFIRMYISRNQMKTIIIERHNVEEKINYYKLRTNKVEIQSDYNERIIPTLFVAMHLIRAYTTFIEFNINNGRYCQLINSESLDEHIPTQYLNRLYRTLRIIRDLSNHFILSSRWKIKLQTLYSQYEKSFINDFECFHFIDIFEYVQSMRYSVEERIRQMIDEYKYIRIYYRSDLIAYHQGFFSFNWRKKSRIEKKQRPAFKLFNYRTLITTESSL